jgi:hypothetical protein
MHIGILGGGNISDTHARAAAVIPGVTVAACYGSNRERTRQLASRHNAVVYDDLDRFLSHKPNRESRPRATACTCCRKSRSTSPQSAPTS